MTKNLAMYIHNVSTRMTIHPIVLVLWKCLVRACAATLKGRRVRWTAQRTRLQRTQTIIAAAKEAGESSVHHQKILAKIHVHHFTIFDKVRVRGGRGAPRIWSVRAIVKNALPEVVRATAINASASLGNNGMKPPVNVIVLIHLVWRTLEEHSAHLITRSVIARAIPRGTLLRIVAV